MLLYENRMGNLLKSKLSEFILSVDFYYSLKALNVRSVAFPKTAC